VRSRIDKPRDLGLLFSRRNIILWVSFLFFKKNQPQHYKYFKREGGEEGRRGSCTKRLTRWYKATGTEGGKSNPVQYSQRRAEEGELLEPAPQVLLQTGGQPKRRVGCGTGSAHHSLLWGHPELGDTGRREAGGIGERLRDFSWGCVGEAGKARFLPALPGYCASSALSTERSGSMGDRAGLQMINCIKKKQQCLLAELCNGLHINLREILCGITAASQEFGCRSQAEDGSWANRRSRR